jgi:hypothetical protein
MGVGRGAPVLVPGFEFRVPGADPSIPVRRLKQNALRNTRNADGLSGTRNPEPETRNIIPPCAAQFILVVLIR